MDSERDVLAPLAVFQGFSSISCGTVRSSCVDCPFCFDDGAPLSHSSWSAPVRLASDLVSGGVSRWPRHWWPLASALAVAVSAVLLVLLDNE